MNSPDSHIIGKNSRLLYAGAAAPLVNEPMKKPIAQNGIEPSTSVTQMTSTCAPVSVIRSATSATIVTRVKAAAPKIIDCAIFDTRFAPPGIGSARLSLKTPPSRSSARVTPLKMPGINTEKVENPAKR